MSFILDALRKSDARRQQSAAPGINSPEPPRPQRSRRPRRWPLMTLALLIVLAGASLAILRPEWLPMIGLDEADAPQVTDTTDAPARRPQAEQPSGQGEDSAAIRERLARQHGSESGNDRRRMPPQPPAEEANRPGGSTPSSEPDESSPRRVPVPSAPTRVVRREPQPQRESEPVRASEATAELERRMAEAKARQREARAETGGADEADRRPAEPGGPAGGDSSESARSTRSAPARLEEGVSEFVRDWELPLSVRRNLPDLDLNIHVFSPEASERFVLINGERYTAGDSIGEARIVDIRREGAVIDFRSHRFLLEPR